MPVDEQFTFVVDETGYWQVTAIAMDMQKDSLSEAATRGETVLTDERYEYMEINLDHDALRKVVDKDLFDYTAIEEVIYLNCSTGAYMYYEFVARGVGPLAYILPYNNDGSAGHTGMLLVDNEGRSMYFSCNGSTEDGYANFVLRYLSADETERFLDNDGLGNCDSYPLYQVLFEHGTSVLYASDTIEDVFGWCANDNAIQTLPLERFDAESLADYLLRNVDAKPIGIYPITGISNHQLFTSEMYVYDHAVGLGVTRDEGMQMYLQALYYFNGDEKYDFMEQNCDYFVLDIMGLSSIVTADQEEYLKDRYLPNKVYSKLEKAANDPSRYDLPENVLRKIK